MLVTRRAHRRAGQARCWKAAPPRRGAGAAGPTACRRRSHASRHLRPSRTAGTAPRRAEKLGRRADHHAVRRSHHRWQAGGAGLVADGAAVKRGDDGRRDRDRQGGGRDRGAGATAWSAHLVTRARHGGEDGRRDRRGPGRLMRPSAQAVAELVSRACSDRRDAARWSARPALPSSSRYRIRLTSTGAPVVVQRPRQLGIGHFGAPR